MSTQYPYDPSSGLTEAEWNYYTSLPKDFSVDLTDVQNRANEAVDTAFSKNPILANTTPWNTINGLQTNPTYVTEPTAGLKQAASSITPGNYVSYNNKNYTVDSSGKIHEVFIPSTTDVVGEIFSNPVINTLAATAANVFGGPLGSAAYTAAKGGNLSDIAKSAAMAYVTQELKGAFSSPTDVTVPTSAEALPASFDKYLAPASNVTVPSVIPGLPSSFDTYLSPNQNLDIFKDTTYDTPVDYSLGGTNAPRIADMGDAQGFQVPPINEPVTVGDTPIDYGLNVSVPFTGLQMPTIPNIDSMGGGQGLSIDVPGGKVAEGGFVPTGTLPSLGDPTSFINDPKAIDKAIATNTIPTGMTEDQFLKLIKGFTGLFGAAATNNLIQRPTVQTPTDFSVPTQGVPTYSPEYFQQVQQGYNQLLPNQPKDVVTPLQNWYNTPYSGKPDSVTAKLFGVI